MEAYQEPKIPVKKIYSGKVRDLYLLDDRQLLLVATDRISAFDFVLPTLIPGKGIVLNQLSVFWFHLLGSVVSHHLIADRWEDFPDYLKPFSSLQGRSMVVRKTEKIPIECVVRGYLAGSAWKDYEKTGSICGIRLPAGLKLNEKLPEPIFTPATKEEKGKHDQNISFDQMVDIVGYEVSSFLREKSLQLYERASQYACLHGIIIADSKFEFGLDGKEIILIDEVFTPDSSRFWEKSRYEVGKVQDSLDKQYIRDYLESIHWNKQPPVPALPQAVVRKTQEKYYQIYRLLTGKEISAE